MMQEDKEQTSSTSTESTAETAHNSPDYTFTTDDIMFVVEMLAGIAHKWEEIAISLRLPKVARVECERGSSLQLKLHNVIEKWIEGQHSSKIPTTLQSLKKVLAGPIIQESVLADEVGKKLVKKMGPLFPSTTSDAKEQLITRYSGSPDISCGFWAAVEISKVWCPVKTRSFINLALIKSTEGTNKSHYSIRGDADDIIQSKDQIGYDKVFDKYESGLTVLVLGRPGSGKTTLVHKVCKDWSKGEALTEAELVFLISLRVVNTLTDHSSLTQLLRPYYFKTTISENVTKMIEEKNGKGVCFILDGFDEYLCSDERNSVVYALLNKSYLPQAMVIITSRPAAASAKLSTMPSVKRIEVFGFTKEQTYEYIDSFPFTTSNESDLETHSSNLKTYLKINPQVLHMCYLPVNTAIICFVYDNEPNNMPQTQTKIYETFTKLIVLRHLIRTERCTKLNTLAELTKEDAQHFYKICQLAYNTTITSQQVISQDNDDLEDISLGLATIDITASVNGFQNTYTFLHLTLQEFLAAYYISKLPQSKQMNIIDEHAQSVNMVTVWKFYFGLVNFEEGLERAKKLLYEKNWKTRLIDLQYAYESRQEIICKMASSERLDFVSETLTCSDMSAIAYVMSTTAAYTSDTPTSTKPTTKLSLFSGPLLDDDAMMTLITQLTDKAVSYLKKLHIVFAKLNVSTLEALANLLQHGKLNELRFSVVKLDVQKLKALFQKHIFYRDLKSLTIRESYMTCDCIEILTTAVSYTQIMILDLDHNSFGDNGAKTLIRNTNVETLILSCNGITDDGAVAIATELTTNTTLQKLRLSHNDIRFDGAMALLYALVYNSTLVELNLSDNEINKTGKTFPSGTHDPAPVQGSTASCFSPLNIPLTSRSGGLKKLDISDNKIDVDTAMTIADHALGYYTHLEMLDLSRHNISSNGVIDVCLKLLHHATLHSLSLSRQQCEPHTLDLSCNNITSADAVALANGIKKINWTPPLLSPRVEVRLSFNLIDDHGAQALLSTLHSHGIKMVSLHNNPTKKELHKYVDATTIISETHEELYKNDNHKRTTRETQEKHQIRDNHPGTASETCEEVQPKYDDNNSQICDEPTETEIQDLDTDKSPNRTTSEKELHVRFTEKNKEIQEQSHKQNNKKHDARRKCSIL